MVFCLKCERFPQIDTGLYFIWREILQNSLLEFLIIILISIPKLFIM